MNDVLTKTEAEQAVILKHWETKTSEGTVPVYSHDCAGMGLPTLGTCVALEKILRVSVNHAGYGVFIAKRGGEEIFSFCGGGAMRELTDEAGHRITSWSNFTGTEEAYKTLENLSGEGIGLNAVGRAGIQRAREFVSKLR